MLGHVVLRVMALSTVCILRIYGIIRRDPLRFPVFRLNFSTSACRFFAEHAGVLFRAWRFRLRALHPINGNILVGRAVGGDGSSDPSSLNSPALAIITCGQTVLGMVPKSSHSSPQ